MEVKADENISGYGMDMLHIWWLIGPAGGPAGMPRAVPAVGAPSLRKKNTEKLYARGYRIQRLCYPAGME